MNPTAEIIALMPFLLRYARHLCHDGEEAADLRSETLCRALENIDRYDPAKNVKSWLVAIMLNCFITAYNRRRLTFTYRNRLKANRGREMSHSDPATTLDLAAVVNECCKDEVLMFAAGYDCNEIAKAKGILAATIRSRIFAERRRLRLVFGLD